MRTGTNLFRGTFQDINRNYKWIKSKACHSNHCQTCVSVCPQRLSAVSMFDLVILSTFVSLNDLSDFCDVCYKCIK